MKRFLVLIERAEDGRFGAWVPDLPGCAVCGYGTSQEAKASIAAAIDMHLEGMLEDGETVPEPAAQSDFVETSVV